MSKRPRRRWLRTTFGSLTVFTVITLSGVSCAIPTEENPQPITRDQTTTTITAEP